MNEIDIVSHNKTVWDRMAKENSPWSTPVSSSVIEAAKKGHWDVHVIKGPVPKEWLKDIRDSKVLCLASGGGQQAPVLAAAGGDVDVLDISSEQLAKDQQLSETFGLNLRTICGDMQELGKYFPEDHFDFIINPISNLYVPDLSLVWKGCAHVLKSGGTMITGFYNPIAFACEGETLRNSIPFRTPPSEQKDEKPIIFGHSLSQQISGQIDAGFEIAGFMEDHHPNSKLFVADKFLPVMNATRAILKD